jgi:hypothetical protein
MNQNNFKLIFKTFVLCLMIVANTHFAYSQTASILPPAKTTFFDANGNPLVNGKVFHYTPGNTTFKTTWQDSGETIPNTNPVILDAAGRALILGDGSYRQIVKDKNNNVIWDAVTSSTGTGGGGTTATVGDGDLVGTVKPWAGMAAPTQYAFAYGQEFTRASFPLLFSTLTTQQNASCTIGVAALTGLSDTSNIPIGAPIESSCLAAGATVLTKTVSTVTTSSNAIITTTTTARFFPYGNGDGSSTFNAPDLRGKTVAGRCNMGGVACSNLTATYFGVNPSALSTGGTENVSTTLSTGNLPAYTPSGTITNGALIPGAIGGATASLGGSANAVAVGTDNQAAGYAWARLGITQATSTFAGTAQGGTSTPILKSTVQPTQLLNYIIKTLPDSNANSFFGVAEIGGMTGVITCGFGITCAGNSISAVASTVPAPTPTTLGGVFSATCSSSNWFRILDTTGLFGCSQPNFTDLIGSIAIGQIANSLITYAKIQNGTGLSLLGVTGNVAAANADIAAASDNTVMRRSGTSIGFGAIDLAQANSVGSSLLPLANGGLNANNVASNGGIFWSDATKGQILAGTATARLPLLSGATATPVWGAFTLPASVTSGGVPFFSSTSVMGSSALLTANAIMLGGGAGVAPSSLGSLGTTTTLLHGNAAGAPAFGAVVSADMNITTTSCTNQFVTAISAGGVGTCTTDTLASAQHANQGTTTTVLHGNAAGNPSFGAVSLTTDVSGITPIANGGTAQATALAARASSGLNIDGATSTGDANYTILSTDRMVYHTALSAARTDTLPAANSVNAGQPFYITDFRGVASAVNTVTLQRAGADTINGVNTVVAINAQYGAGIFWSDGTSRWTYQPVSVGGGGGTVTNITPGSGISSGTGTAITTTGTLYQVTKPQGRLTVTTGKPVLIADATAQSTLYYDCYNGGKYVSYYNGTDDLTETISGCEVSTAMVSAASAGQVVSGQVYDVWWVNTGANRICLAMSASGGGGGGWASDTAGSNTARGTGYSQLDLTTRAYITNANSITNCFNAATNYGPVSANRGTYLGTIYATANGQTGMAMSPTGASGGSDNILGVYNAYNRVTIKARNLDTATGTTALASNTWVRVAGSASNKIRYVDGLAQSSITTHVDSCAFNTSSGSPAAYMNGAARDWSSGVPPNPSGFFIGTVAGYQPTNCSVSKDVFLPLFGLHSFDAIEAGSGATSAPKGLIVAATQNESLIIELDM